MFSGVPVVDLSPEEDRLCSLLNEFKLHVEQTQPEGPQVECRIAGGWVRDKLLSLPSNDIDLALAHHNGAPFAEAFSAFLTSSHPEIPKSSVAKIESNPDQSKHLETARQILLGLELDYVNLRREDYTEGNRIPTEMAFGTPLEDALRRDITINALFYNVHTRMIEDWTEKGLSDLQSGLIRTPLPPQETFRDDPLRMIRCVRFASRYGFSLDNEIVLALSNPDLQKALREGISRERVGIELDKMFASRNALLSIQLIERLSLYSSIFLLPPVLANTLSSPLKPSSSALSAGFAVQALFSPQEGSALPLVHPYLLQEATVSRRHLFLAAATVPYHGLSIKIKGKERSAVESLVKDGIKLSGADALFVQRLDQSYEVLADNDLDKFAGPTRRSTIGNLLRLPHIHNPSQESHWTVSIFWSLAHSLIPHVDPATGSFQPEARAVVERFNAFVTEVVALDLPQAIDQKPILDGKELISILSIKGPMLKTALERVVTWQLDHPSGTKEECAAQMKEDLAAGLITTPVEPLKGNAKKKQKI